MTRVSNPVLRRLTEVAAMPDLPGGRYTLQEQLGEGGMGAVYSGYDESLDREVAVKVAHAHTNGALAERLRAEARVLARLEHPGIVPVHDVGLLPDGRLFYVMKRVRGHTLTEWLREVLDLNRRLTVFERICEAVAFAHEQGIVHRDLKPDNIMVGAFGEVLVLDWGVAKLLSEMAAPQRTINANAVRTGDTLAGTVLGTPGFMAPEQAQGRPVDRRADVFALGAILYQLLLDQPPAEDGLPAAELQKRRELPKRLRAVCAKALAPAIDARYPDASTLAEEIARYRAGRSVLAYRETAFDKIERTLLLYRTPILLVLAYLLMRVLIALFAR
ncbi:MAG: serine/threonine-protein kinase [Longimicrobiales bacterium]